MKLEKGIADYNLPSAFRMVESVIIQDEFQVKVCQVDPNFFRHLNEEKKQIRGIPIYFAIIGKKIHFYPIPVQDIEVLVKYYESKEI